MGGYRSSDSGVIGNVLRTFVSDLDRALEKMTPQSRQNLFNEYILSGLNTISRMSQGIPGADSSEVMRRIQDRYSSLMEKYGLKWPITSA